MRKESKEAREKRLFGGLHGKIKEATILAVLAVVLLVTAWFVFRGGGSTNTAATMSDTEAKVARILEEIDGVGEANVIVCETKEGIESVVVVCEGAQDIRVVMNVREAVAAALGTSEKSVKIYLKKE